MVPPRHDRRTGYAGKFVERARELRAQSWTLQEIADEFGVAKVSGSSRRSNAALIRIFVTWLRKAFTIDESRLRMTLYLHSDLDLDAASDFWSRAMDIPRQQFTKPYRAVADPTRRSNRHINGCVTVVYSCSLTHRRVMARIQAVTFPFDLPG